MTATVAGILLTGTHASRPAANAVSAGTLYSCTTHSLIYQSDGTSTWSTYADLTVASGAITSSGLTMSTAKMLGRTTASTGAIEEITVGTGLSLSAGTLSSTASGAPSDAKYITASLNGSLSAEIDRPELDDYSSGGSTVSLASPTSDAGVSTGAVTDMATSVTFTQIASRATAYVSSAVGTGNFDYRMRLADWSYTTPHTTTSTPRVGLFVSDSSGTASTRLSMEYASIATTTGISGPQALGVINTTGNGQSVFLDHGCPIILRLQRTSTTVTFYVSTNEGRNWMTQSTTTSSLNVARVGIIGHSGSATTPITVALIHWLRSF